MHSFRALVFQFLGLCSITPFRGFLRSPISRYTELIRRLLKEGKFGAAIKIAREWKPYRHYSLSLAREIAFSECAARYWREAAESWTVVCGFPFGTRRGDWLQLAKVQQTAGLWEDAIVTLRKMKKRYSGNDITSLWTRLRKLEEGYQQVDSQVLAWEPGAYKITYFKNKEPSSTIVVTFGFIYSDFTSTPFGFPFISRQGFDQIHVAQERFTYYQLLDLDVFLGAVGGICRGKNVVAYGSSIGAYAAFYFGGPLGAKILAASPRNSTDDCITRFSKNVRNVKLRHGKISDHQTSPEKPVVFWDPLGDKRDRVYLRERILPAYPKIDVIGIPHGGHATFKYLRDTKILKEVFLSVVRGDFSAEKTKESLGLSTGPVPEAGNGDSDS